MGGFFAAVGNKEVISDVFFGTDYHSHLGTRSGGMAAFDTEIGLQRNIHSLGNNPFRTKFAHVLSDVKGFSAIGCINDSDPQPLLIRSKIGAYAICTVGIINNAESLINEYLSSTDGHFEAMTGGKVNTTELVAALINRKNSFAEGISYVQSLIDGTLSILILTNKGNLIVARDKNGRLPVQIGKKESGFCVSFESYAYRKLGYEDEKELGPGEIVKIKSDGIEVLKAPGKKMRICAFLWTYYGYPNSDYEGVNVEMMRYKNGAILAENDKKNARMPDIDFVGGVPDSGTPHAIGYANKSGIPFARPYIKYTPTWSRSFMPTDQIDRNEIAKMKQVPVQDLIKDRKLLFVDDSIVRGTQLRETVEFLTQNGAKAVHMRSACPPIMFGCKYLNFSRSTSDMELLARRVIVELEGEEGFKYIEEYSDGNTERGRKLRAKICEAFRFDSLEFQTLEGVCEAIGVDAENLCTYCWNGKE